MVEEWKPIPGYEGLYDASNLGRIRTHPGRITKDWRGGLRQWEKTIVMHPKHHSTRGDYKLTLYKDKTKKDCFVARLVALAWLGVPNDPQMTVNHINGDYLDNRVENLEWLSHDDNLRHGFKTGLFHEICRTVTLVDRNGNHQNFYSMQDASRFLGWSGGYIRQRIKRGFPNVFSKDGTEYKYFIEVKQ